MVVCIYMFDYLFLNVLFVNLILCTFVLHRLYHITCDIRHFESIISGFICILPYHYNEDN